MRGQWAYDISTIAGTNLHIDERKFEQGLKRDMEKSVGGRPLNLKFTWAWDGTRRVLTAEEQ